MQNVILTYFYRKRITLSLGIASVWYVPVPPPRQPAQNPRPSPFPNTTNTPSCKGTDNLHCATLEKPLHSNVFPRQQKKPLFCDPATTTRLEQKGKCCICCCVFFIFWESEREVPLNGYYQLPQQQPQQHLKHDTFLIYPNKPCLKLNFTPNRAI